VFLLTLLLVGHIAAVAVVGLLYAEAVNIQALAVVLELFAVVTVLRLLRVLRIFAYLVVGVALWVATSASGIHPAITGLLLGVVLTAYPPVPTQVLRVTRLRRWFDPDPPPAILWEAPPGPGHAVPPIQRLQGQSVQELLSGSPAGLAEVNGDDTLVKVAATLVRAGVSLVAVRDPGGRLLGGITTSRLIRRLLGGAR
jgi:Na+/H+ antiporter 1